MTENRPVRVRFAPSPTGKLHIGGARTALFNWAFARRHGGVFILRIEDTDTERNSQESLDSILSAMRWLGLDWDEGPGVGGDFGPYAQSERMPLYDAAIQKGLTEGWLYRCFCTPERVNALKEEQRNRKENPRYDRACLGLPDAECAKRLEVGEPHVIRFAVPDSETAEIQDHIRGQVTVQSVEVEDWVVVRSNGMPTYNFCCVIDDAQMQISHVVRGEEHLANTPKQVLLYRALGLPQPDYAHVPLILGQDGKKLSKRTGDTALQDYRDKGYPAEAMLNFLGLLGFSIDDETTVFSADEMVAAFDLKRINKSGAIFDTDKLHWLCGDTIRRMTDTDLLERLRPWLNTAVCDKDGGWLLQLAACFRERLTLFGDVSEMSAHLFCECVEPDEKAAKALSADGVADTLSGVADLLAGVESWPPPEFFALVKGWAAEHELGVGKVMKPVRAALTGSLGGPELGDVLALLGKDCSLARLRQAR
ncbi:MAG: glutamate--tRNA ligase [Planctomycetes bacterium]|jgi:glutamyl-tRNA synthetase|nr:glutamate--tRNA ligase [Planctomycetota bacterium]MBT4028888.1 glutamate--tRNA ligase [Planctomycetota bacterium]MBT4559552.1 glutamate--tRNA ligase [Planctomycetota bacterium]MBT5100883.1 glutamate--tRNA ligase [Planctomycetota bacterium]MBT7318922.1 glutamate--tRNA ligase [Planctomycetota bacterium]